ncbi:hypothetical protein BH23VER1_BH23VER1_31650 [soil metagenome]
MKTERLRTIGLCALSCALLLSNCKFEAPLVAEDSVPIDPKVLGLWELIPDEGDDPERMMVLPFSRTEYLIHYPIGERAFYFRGYPIEVGGISCVQIRAVGTVEGPLDADETALYDVVTYQLQGDKLTVRTLNTDVVRQDLADPASLQRAFLENAENPNLFAAPGMFKKVPAAP